MFVCYDTSCTLLWPLTGAGEEGGFLDGEVWEGCRGQTAWTGCPESLQSQGPGQAAGTHQTCKHLSAAPKD